ncbi:odorant receptor 4-like [Nylanderia fulva]|uniref:odorant receptor 4-like n=1 Tax=Nylanderia fulva TaxID=613905 RepID=UPI0010FB6757|nr:odorant receptor 4-like [Nylanderia fulva]
MKVNKDLSYAFTLSRQCLRLLGVWPDPYVSLNIFRPNIRFLIVVCILSIYVIVPQLTNMLRAWGNVSLMVEYLASANFCLMALSKLIATWYHGETLRTLMTSVVTDWRTSNPWERDTMLNIARRGRSLAFKCGIAATCTVTFYVSLNLLKFYRNVHLPQRNLVYRFSHFPYNIQKSPNYEITFFIQLSGGVYSALINCTVDCFVSILLLHMCAQLINLRMTLNNLVGELANKSISSSRFKGGLRMIAIRHQHLIRSVRTIDDCYSAVLFIHMLAATFQLCLETFQVFTMITDNVEISLIKVAFLSFYVVLVLTHLYIYCYSAERLITESTSIAYGVYECKWYDLPVKEAKDLMFIVYGSTIPLRLTAGKFGVFSIEMFGTTIKTSMGYVSALLAIKD